MTEIEKIIETLELKSHPEGGYFKEIYRSKGFIDKSSLPSEFSGKRNYSTSIYFMLTSDDFSAFHRINQDEIWHFYKGSPIKLHVISDTGNYSKVIIGNHLEKEETLQYVVPAKFWFAAEVINKNDFSLVGCTVSPGFDFNDFELPKRKQLIDLYPQHKNMITKFTRE